MLKKSITFENFEGEKVTEDFYFNLSQVEIMDLAIEDEDIGTRLQKIIESQDGKGVIQTMKDFILLAYGEKSADGKRFIKSEELTAGFKQTEAYAEMLFELCTDATKAIEFITGIVPKSMAEKVAKQEAEALATGTTVEQGLKRENLSKADIAQQMRDKLLERKVEEVSLPEEEPVDLNAMTPEELTVYVARMRAQQ